MALLLQRHSASIGLYAARRLGPGPAEDIVAETFLEAFRHRDRYDTARRDARPWLYGIVGNLIRRHHRDEVRKLRALARTGVDPKAASPRQDARSWDVSPSGPPTFAGTGGNGAATSPVPFFFDGGPRFMQPS